MAKHGKRRSGLKVVKFEQEIALSTLAGNTLIAADVADLLTDRDAYIISGDIMVGLVNNVAGEGPLEVGLANNGYTTAEVEEWIENTGGMTSADLSQQEVRRRLIRSIGMLSGVGATESLFDGAPRRVRIRFKLTAGAAISVWCYNHENAAKSGSAIVVVSGTIYYRHM